MKKTLYLIMATILLAACQQENAWNAYPGDGAVILTIAPQPAVQNRAEENGTALLNENKIDNIHLFFFPQNASDTEACVRYQTITALNFLGTGTLTQELPLSRTLFASDAPYDVYAIANLPANLSIAPSLTLGELKALHTLTPISSTGLQSNFLMDGKTTTVLNPNQPTPVVDIRISLQRAAAKIRVKFVIDPATEVANATVAQVSLCHYAANTSLLAGSSGAISAGNYANSDPITGTPASTFTFYCYESNWGTTTAHQAYLLVNIPYSATASNYYRIPLNKYAGNNETGRIERNRIYDFTAYITQPGTPNESGMLAISGNYLITDWNTKDILWQTVNQHYLSINESNIEMTNIATYTLKYASDLPISITAITATCTQYSSTGTSSTVAYTAGHAQYPLFTISPAASTITINSAIPINYVPKYITFTVTNNQGLSHPVTIVQYPARYVTARLSTGNVKPEWSTGGTNLNLFTVTTLVPSPNGAYTLGDPTFGFSKTDSIASTNKMVSPRFIIASQYGIYSRVTYPVAQNRCLQYGEDIYRSGWRMPTKAEIELINAIQDDPNSAVKALLTGDAYWSAYKYDYYDFSNNAWVNTNATGTAYVRAIYDLYKYEQ